MSESEAELKELLLRSLNENGIISRLQAQLRAAVYLALEKHNYNERMPPANEFIRSLRDSEDGLVLLSLFTEFLRHAQLESTLEVFTHEAELSKTSIIDRDGLIKLLNLDSKPDSALLSTLVSAHQKLRTSHRIDSGSLEQANSGDDAQLSRLSRIPVLRNRRFSAPMSYDPTHEQLNGREDGADGSFIMTNSLETQLPPDGKTLHANQPVVVNDSLSSQIRTRFYNSASDHVMDPQKTDYNLNGSPFCPASSPRNEERQGDFASPATLHSERISSATDRPSELDKRSGSQSVSIHLIESARSPTPVNSLSPRNGGEISRSTSRSGTPSIIRIYSQASRRSASAEESSDIDGDDDQVSELLREYSIADDSVDQTIDSDQSLGLDHVEVVKHPPNISSPSH